MAYGKIVAGVLKQKQPYFEPGFVVISDDAVCEQVTTDGGKTFKDPPPNVLPVTVPEVVEAWQAKRALIDSGHYAAVADAIASLPDDPDSLRARVDWTDAKTFRRDWPALNTLAGVVGLDAGDLDALFIHAATL